MNCQFLKIRRWTNLMLTWLNLYLPTISPTPTTRGASIMQPSQKCEHRHHLRSPDGNRAESDHDVPTCNELIGQHRTTPRIYPLLIQSTTPRHPDFFYPSGVPCRSPGDPISTPVASVRTTNDPRKRETSCVHVLRSRR